MAEWTTLDLNNSLLANGVKTLIGNVAGPLEVVATQAEVVAGLVEALSVLLAGGVDALGAARAAIDALVQDLLYAGVYGLVIQPRLRGGIQAPMGIDGFLRAVNATFYDPGDTNRPVYGWGDSTSGVLLVVGASSLPELANLASALQVLFGVVWSDLINLANSTSITVPYVTYSGTGVVTGLVPGQDPTTTFVGSGSGAQFDTEKGKLLTFITGDNSGQTSIVSAYDQATSAYTLMTPMPANIGVGDGYGLAYNTASTPPDWYRGRLLDAVPPLSTAVDVLVQVRNLIPATGASALAGRLVTGLQRRAALLRQASAQLAGVVSAIDNLSVVPVVSILPIPPQSGGNGGFSNEAFSATNRPEIPSNYYTIGVVLYGGSSTFGLLQRIFGI